MIKAQLIRKDDGEHRNLYKIRTDKVHQVYKLNRESYPKYWELLKTFKYYKNAFRYVDNQKGVTHDYFYEDLLNKEAKK